MVTSVVKEGEVESPKKGLYFGGERPTPSKDTHHWMVYGFDWKTGKKVWERQVHEGSSIGWPRSLIALDYAREGPPAQSLR